MKTKNPFFLNFLRNIKGRFDLFMVLMRWDRVYRKEITIVVMALLLITYSIIDMDDVWDYFALALEFGILMLQFGSEMSVLPPKYRPLYAGVRYFSQTCTHVWNNKRSFPMTDILPPKAEEECGFHNPIADKGYSTEIPFAGDRIDDRIMLTDALRWQEENREVNYITSNLQILYLALRVGTKTQHTTNGTKLALAGMVDGLLEDKPVTLRKSYYFDALLTNEAFRSRLIRRNLRGHEEIYSDLSAYFPVRQEQVDGRTGLRITPDFYEKVSGHIGVTTLLLTDTGHIGMLHQGAGKVIDARKVGLGGSGSMDYGDFEKAGRPEDLRDALAYGMARELAEETGTKAHFDHLRQNTMVTGFFRWVDRCAKPEFVGITRAAGIDFTEEGAIDGDEIVRFEEMPVTIRKMKDFQKALAYIRENGLKISLSSLMALQRMVTIAGYDRPDATPQQRQVYEKMTKFLFAPRD
ncbi:MAG: hypothetical protein EA357_10710 [Micavibrio sp.]|nr:MAG: hypothetical protein EA357_10710 [Micavibrio sp.]